MKLSHYHEPKELTSTKGRMLWFYEERDPNFGEQKNKVIQLKQVNAARCSFAHFHAGCSLLLITALNSGVNKTC